MSPGSIAPITVAAGAALLTIAWAARRNALAAGAWFAAGLLGQAVSLQLINAGPTVSYQHYRPLTVLIEQYPAQLLAILALLTALALSAPRLLPVARKLVRRMSRGALLVVTAGFILTAATLSRQPAAYLIELCGAAAIQLLALGTVAMAVVSLPEEVALRLRRRIDRLLEGPAGGPAGVGPVVDWYIVVLAIAVALIAAGLSVWSYQRQPHIPDEVAYLFQAKYFARGMLFVPAPPVPSGFDLDLVQMDHTRWFSVFPPGWPAALALGVRAGVPWLVNPVLGGFNVILAAVLLGELYDRRTARLAVTLLALSPWHLFLAMSFMSHTLSLTLALTAGVAIAAARRTGAAAPAVVAGLAVGVIGLTRPLEGLVVGLLVGAAALGSRGAPFRLAPLAGLGLGTAVSGALGLWYNRAITGGLLRFPVEEYFARVYGAGHYEIGFGPTRGLGWTGLDPLPGHGLLDVFINANLNGFAVNTELFGWWCGSLLPVLLGAVLGWRGRSTRVMLAAIGAVVLAQSFYWFSGGPDFGARYWFLIIVPCVALSAAGIEHLGALEASRPAAARSGRVHLAVAALCLLALLTFVPWRAIDKYHDYRGMRPDVRRMAQDPRLRGGLVLVRGNRHPDFAAAAVYNALDLSGDAPVFAWDRDETTRRALLEAFPNRAVWILDGPTVTGRGYELRAAR